MLNSGKLAGKTLFITGASRGIGKAIALKAARDGANVVIAAKTAIAHPKLPGTIYTAAKEVEDAGGKALPCVVDIRDESQVKSAVENAVKVFGGIDILVNNASAISVTGTLHTDMKRYDLMHHINTRGTFLVSKLCLPHLIKGHNPHVLNISPPLNLSPRWFKDHVAYTMAKYGMSMCVLGMAEEFKKDGVAVNALWPKTTIHTAAIEMLAGPESGQFSRKPEIMGDAAYTVFLKDSKTLTGQFLIDEDVLKKEGVSNMVQYAVNPANADKLMLDGFLEGEGDATFKHAESAAPSSGSGNSSQSGTEIEKLFSAIQGKLNEDLVSKINAVFLFKVKGTESGEDLWYIDLKTGSGTAGKGNPSTSPDTTVEMKEKALIEMFTGKLKPAAAFMTGTLKVTGNLQKAMKLEGLIRK